jgi:hypothetical protein
MKQLLMVLGECRVIEVGMRDITNNTGIDGKVQHEIHRAADGFILD